MPALCVAPAHPLPPALSSPLFTLVSRSAAAGDAAQAKQILERSAHAFKGGQLRAWHKWREVLEELRGPSHASAHHDAPPFPQVLEELREARAIASRIVTLGPPRAFNRWRGFVDEKERLRSLTKRIIASGLVRGLNAWVDSLDKTGKRRMGRFARRMVQRALSKAWLCWMDLVVEIAGALRHEPCPTQRPFPPPMPPPPR